MFEVNLGHYLTLGATIFTIGIVGIFLNRKNIIEKAYKYVEEYVGKARDKLDVIPLSHRDKLKQFTNIILKRVK